MKFRSLALGCLIAWAIPAAAWGDKGHRIIASCAVRGLPPVVGAWFSGQEGLVVGHASDPDHWKKDRKEAPRHFLNCEVYGGAASVPRSAQEAIGRVGVRRFQKSGQLPWAIQDQVRVLATAFRSRDRGRVLLESSYLSHYVGDLHVPLHTTVNYDGRETDQRGVHSRWETGLVERYVAPGSLRVLPSAPGRATLQSPWRWLQETHSLVGLVLQDDRLAGGVKRHRGRRQQGAYWPLFWAAEGNVVKGQLERAGQRTGDLIVLAWEMGGRPRA
nr:S1/P1 nuclease [uncultured Holophaga sp.]